MFFLFLKDVTQFGQKHIRRTEQLGLSGVENHDPGQRPDKMRTLRRLPAGLGVRGICTRFWQRCFAIFFRIRVRACIYIHGAFFRFLTEPFGTLWSPARELFARNKNVHQKRNARETIVVERKFFIR